MVDPEALLVTLLTTQFPDADVAAAVDTESIERMPVVVVQAVNGTSINGPHLAFEWQIDVSVVAVGRDAARTLASDVRDYLHSLNARPLGRVDGVGAVGGVDDLSLPTRTATAELNAQHLHQFDAAYTVRVRPA